MEQIISCFDRLGWKGKTKQLQPQQQQQQQQLLIRANCCHKLADTQECDHSSSNCKDVNVKRSIVLHESEKSRSLLAKNTRKFKIQIQKMQQNNDECARCVKGYCFDLDSVVLVSVSIKSIHSSGSFGSVLWLQRSDIFPTARPAKVSWSSLRRATSLGKVRSPPRCSINTSATCGNRTGPILIPE